MPSFKIAHVKEQGVNVIIVPLSPRFSDCTEDQRASVIAAFQTAAEAATLRGRIVPMWRSGGSQVRFIAPPDWASFFERLKWKVVMRNLNRELDCPAAEALGLNPALTGKEGMGMFEALGQWLIDTAKGLMEAIAASSKPDRGHK